MSVKKICFPYYLVKEGDNLRTLSNRFEIDGTKILIDNNISPKQIRPGTILKIEK